METLNCKNCGRLFIHQHGPQYCPKCRSIMEEKFEKVKDYLYDHPGSSIQHLAEVNDVSTQQIVKWVREERLEFTADSIVGIDCEICGGTIKTGRFCKSCKNDIAMKLGKAFDKPVTEELKKELREKHRKGYLDSRLINTNYTSW